MLILFIWLVSFHNVKRPLPDELTVSMCVCNLFFSSFTLLKNTVSCPPNLFFSEGNFQYHFSCCLGFNNILFYSERVILHKITKSKLLISQSNIYFNVFYYIKKSVSASGFWIKSPHLVDKFIETSLRDYNWMTRK